MALTTNHDNMLAQSHTMADLEQVGKLNVQTPFVY